MTPPASKRHKMCTRADLLSSNQKLPASKRHKRHNICAPADLLSLNEDIMVQNILPFVGMGHFAFVAGVSRQMKQAYKAYCDIVKDPPLVYGRTVEERNPATAVDTFDHAVFSSVACAEFWDSQESTNRAPVFRDYTTAYIAKTGNLHVLEWAHMKNFPWNEQTCYLAAKTGHLEVLRYAHEKGCPWNEKTCHLAAFKGHLEVLRYAHECGCPWNEETCRLAAFKGHLEVLRYAHECGCPWNEETCHLAAYKGHLEVLRYAQNLLMSIISSPLASLFVPWTTLLMGIFENLQMSIQSSPFASLLVPWTTLLMGIP
jgi:hypothetical protein